MLYYYKLNTWSFTILNVWLEEKTYSGYTHREKYIKIFIRKYCLNIITKRVCSWDSGYNKSQYLKVQIVYLYRRTIILEIKCYSWIEALIRQPLTFNSVTFHIPRYRNIRLINGLNENCCFGCGLWLLGRFQRLVCKLILKGLVPSHSEKSPDFSRWEIINI